MTRNCAGCGTTIVLPDDKPRRTKWCSERCRRRTMYSKPCPRCGTPMSGNDGPIKGPTLCQKCDRELNGDRMAALFESHRQELVALWNAGLSIKQIAEVMHLTPGGVNVYMVRLRKQGYDLPYRNAGYPK